MIYTGKMNFTLADVVLMTSAKRRSVQLWADAGIIRAETFTERRGTGTHRRFGRDEVIIASIIKMFSRRQVSIGELQRLANSIRKFLGSSKNRSLLEEAISGKPKFLVITWTRPHESIAPRWMYNPAVTPINVIDLGHLDEKLGAKMRKENAIFVLISLHHCLAGLKRFPY